MSLPKGWEVKKLGEVCNIVGGGTPDKSNHKFYEGHIPWATVRDMKTELLETTEYSITEDAVNRSSTNIIPKNNVIIATRVGLGKVCYLINDTAINQDLRGVIPKDKNLLVPFLFYWFKSIAKQIVDAGTGATVHGVKLPFVKALEIPSPPLPEQQCIVEILDEAFSGIDAAIANTERAIANSKELFDSELNRIFSQRGEGWATFKLEELCESISTGPFGSLLHKSDYVNFGTPLINPINIINDTIVPNEEKQVNDETLQRLQQYQLNINDIVVARRGEMGRCAVIGQEQAGWLCGTGCLFMRPSNKILSEFIAILLRSNYYRKQLEDVATGATMLNLSNKSLGDLYVSIPNIKGQSQLLNHLETLKNQTQALEAVYQQKLAALQELKQSLLHKAFTGELTAHWQGEA